MAATLQRVISRRTDSSRTVHVAVVGLSGSEADKGSTGVGKSCLCNRFVRPHADSYSSEHISVLSQSDFGGRVINNEHFMYWGGASRVTDDGATFHFQVVEQTEFVDDTSFQAFSTASADHYVKRCVATRLSSPDKLMYVCKNQLGIEREYEQVLLPDGRFSVDGFLCVFDVSDVSGRPLSKQVEVTAQILSSIVRTRKPVVLATCKNDEARLSHVREAERLASRREFRGNIPLVETSAHLDVNVALAFITLAQLVERGRGKVRLVPYAESVRLRRHLLAVLADSFESLLRVHVCDYRASSSSTLQRLQSAPQLLEYVAAHGTLAAHRALQRHLQRLKDDHVARRVQRHLPALSRTLTELFGDGQCLVGCEWSEVRRCLRQHPQAALYFTDAPMSIDSISADDDVGMHGWMNRGDGGEHDGELGGSGGEDDGRQRVPFHVLDTSGAEMVFRNFINAVQQQSEQKQLCVEFRQLLADTGYVTPGRPLSEVRVLFLGRPCFEALSESDRQLVYEEYQQQLLQQARADFQELLLERADLFCQLSAGSLSDTMSQRQLESLSTELMNDSRFRALDRFGQDRSLLLLQHAAFISAPRALNCPAGDLCVDLITAQLLAEPPSSTAAAAGESVNSCSESSAVSSRDPDDLMAGTPPAVNVAIVGVDSCSERLDTALLLRCDEDEIELEGGVYRLQTTLLGNVTSLTDLELRSRDPIPHGCLCVYSDDNSLLYLRRILHSYKDSTGSPHGSNDSGSDQSEPAVPLLVLFTPDPDLAPADVGRLLADGLALADNIKCGFVDGSAEDDRSAVLHTEASSDSEDRADSGWAGGSDRLTAALCRLLKSSRQRGICGPLDIAGVDSQLELRQRSTAGVVPDIRIMMCFFCGDPYSIDNVVGAILSERTCVRYSDTSLIMDAFLGDCRRRVELLLVSYHGASIQRHSMVHGMILVYSAKRRASLNTLSVFSETLSRLPLQILAVTDADGVSTLFRNQLTQQLITEGNSLADRLQAHFMTSTSTCQQKSAFYLSFFREVWQRKAETERYSQLTGLRFTSGHARSDSGDSNEIARRGHQSSTGVSRRRHQVSSGSHPARLNSRLASVRLTDAASDADSATNQDEDADDVSYDVSDFESGSLSQSGVAHRTVANGDVGVASDQRGVANDSLGVSNVKTSGSVTGGLTTRRSLQQEDYGVGGASKDALVASTESLPSCLGTARSPLPPSGGAHPVSTPGDGRSRQRHTHHRHQVPQQQQQQHRVRRYKKYTRSNTVADDPSCHAEDGLFVFPVPSTPPEPAPSSATLPADSVVAGAVQRLSSASDHGDVRDWSSTNTKGRLACVSSVVSTTVAPLKSPSAHIDPPGRLKLSQFSDVANAVDKLRSRPVPLCSPTSRGAGRASAGRPPVPHRMLASEYAQVKDAILNPESSYTLAHDAMAARMRIRQRKEPANQYASDSDSESSGVADANAPYPTASVSAPQHVHQLQRRTPPRRQRRRRTAIPVAVPRVPSHDSTSNTVSARDNTVFDGDSDSCSDAPATRQSQQLLAESAASDVGRNFRPPTMPSIPLSSPHDYSSSRSEAHGGLTSLQHHTGWTAHATSPVARYKESRALRKDRQRQIKEEEKRKVKEEAKQKKMEKEKLKKEKNKKVKSSKEGDLSPLLPLSGDQVPAFMARCVTLIESDGLDTEGLYRVPGSRADVDLLLERMTSDPSGDLECLDVAVNAVATALKDFIGKRLAPLVPQEKLVDLTNIAAISDRRTRLFKLRVLLRELPTANFQALKFLFQHFVRVTEMCRVNSMDSKNLAICWWPTLIPLQFTDIVAFETIRPHLEDLVQSMIDQAPYLFDDKEERMMV